MDDRRVGRAIRALRLRRGWRQVDVGRRAGVSQTTVSLIERGNVQRLQVGTVRAVAAALGADLTLDMRWRGADLDRLIDARHADLVAATMARLGELAWAVRPEVSFSEYGERGSIDILAWHEGTCTLLVVEVKSALGSLEETLRRHDAKARLATRIATRDLGWRAGAASRLLVLPAQATPRRHVARAETVLAAAYPVRGRELRERLQHPDRPVPGLLFLSHNAPGTRINDPRATRRVRAPSRAPDPSRRRSTSHPDGG